MTSTVRPHPPSVGVCIGDGCVWGGHCIGPSVALTSLSAALLAEAGRWVRLPPRLRQRGFGLVGPGGGGGELAGELTFATVRPAGPLRKRLTFVSDCAPVFARGFGHGRGQGSLGACVMAGGGGWFESARSHPHHWRWPSLYRSPPAVGSPLLARVGPSVGVVGGVLRGPPPSSFGNGEGERSPSLHPSLGGGEGKTDASLPPIPTGMDGGEADSPLF